MKIWPNAKSGEEEKETAKGSYAAETLGKIRDIVTLLKQVECSLQQQKQKTSECDGGQVLLVFYRAVRS
jgi:hypothetical protein